MPNINTNIATDFQRIRTNVKSSSGVGSFLHIFLYFFSLNFFLLFHSTHLNTIIRWIELFDMRVQWRKWIKYILQLNKIVVKHWASTRYFTMQSELHSLSISMESLDISIEMQMRSFICHVSIDCHIQLLFLIPSFHWKICFTLTSP